MRSDRPRRQAHDRGDRLRGQDHPPAAGGRPQGRRLQARRRRPTPKVRRIVISEFARVLKAGGAANRGAPSIEARTSRRRAKSGLLLGHDDDDGAGEMELLLSLCQQRYLPPRDRRLVQRRCGKRRAVQTIVRRRRRSRPSPRLLRASRADASRFRSLVALPHAAVHQMVVARLGLARQPFRSRGQTPLVVVAGIGLPARVIGDEALVSSWAGRARAAH